MKIFKLVLYSKKKKAIQHFLKLATNKIKLLKINITKKLIFKSLTSKKMSILKSPHVHKKAQEQFEFKIFSAKITLQTTQDFKFLTFIKKIKNKTLSEIKIKIKLIYFIKRTTKLKSFKNQKTVKLLNFFDYYGESNFCLDSSEGRAKD